MTSTASSSVTAANPDRRGTVHTSEYVWGACGLGFLAYERSRFDGVEPVGVKRCLRVVTLRKDGSRSFSSVGDREGSISLELSDEAMIGVHAVLTGQCVVYEYRVVRHDRSPKTFTIKFQPEREEGAFFARLEEGSRGYGTPFGFAGSFAFQTVIAAVLRLEYPDRSEDMLMGSHYRMARLYAQRKGP